MADELALARRHATLRFAVGVTAALLFCEAMEWVPSFLAAVFVAALLANLPGRPDAKTSVGLVVVMAATSLFAAALASWLRFMPGVLLGVLGLVIFLALHAMANGRAKVPGLLLLICVAVIPVLLLTVPELAEVLPMAMIRAMAVAMVTIQAVYAAWPRTLPAAPAPAALPASAPVSMALASTAVLLPLMTLYLMFGITDALPVLVAATMLVANFDLHRSRLHALGMILGNLLGGLLGVLLHFLVFTTPSLVFLGLLVFLAMLGFAERIARGGPMAPVVLIACNASLIILGLGLFEGPGSLGRWVTRVFQFALAGACVVMALQLIWHRFVPATRAAAASDA